MTAGCAAPGPAAEWEPLGLSWHPSGQSSLSGPLLALAGRLDRAFLLLAAALWGAREERHPASMPAGTLQRVDYLHSFPHQASFPVRLDPDEANLDAFRAGPVLGPDGDVRLTRLAPAREVLTPAACYHLYAGHEGTSLAGPLYLTTSNTCFRHEARYEPLRRQWSFTMREFVCMGSAPETEAFLAEGRSAVDLLLKRLDVAVEWSVATDPFFRPLQNPQYLMQRVQPSKHEAVYGGELAIGSANQHHDHFGAGFSITRDGGPASSACIAFGIERWLFALVRRHGTDPAAWPDPAGVAAQVTGVPAGEPA